MTGRTRPPPQVSDLGGVQAERQHMQSDVDRVKTDNARLVKMLSSTHEYAEFVQRAYAQSDVAYIAHGSPLVDLRIITEDYAARDEGRDRPLGDAKSEFAHWIPADILNYAQECRTRYFAGVTDDSFGNFMHAMHLRWRAHEQRVLNKRELLHDREKQDMFRQMAHRKPHDVARLEQSVAHLRGQLKNAHPTGKCYAAETGMAMESTLERKEKLLDWSLAAVEQMASLQM
jgi:hypothetical protein